MLTSRLISVHSSRIAVAVIFLAVLVTRLPFLTPGYGVDPDAWRVAGAAKAIAESGQYEYSRMPGHAPHEIIVSLAADAPASFWILVTAAVSAIATMMFWLILGQYHVRDRLLATFAFALTPVIYIESVELLDYVWSLACVLGAMYAVLHRRRLFAGALVGLAVGFGITAGLMLMPVMILAMAAPVSKGSWRAGLVAAAQVFISALATGLLCYVPPYLIYGSAFIFMPAMQPHSILVAAWMASVGVFGIPGAIVLAAVGAGAMWDAIRKREFTPTMPVRPDAVTIIAWLSVLVLHAAFYVRIRGEPSKLIPVVPFVILIMARYADRKAFVALCLALIVSPFTGQFFSSAAPDVPSIIEYTATRRAQMERISVIWQTLMDEPGRVLVVTGSYFEPMMRLMRPPSSQDKVRIETWITAQDIEAQQAAGVQVFCIAEACQWNAARTGFDPREHGAHALTGY